jgi:methionine-rich copper-binding protein CopC
MLMRVRVRVSVFVALVAIAVVLRPTGAFAHNEVVSGTVTDSTDGVLP